jgi:hypothetical protein
MKISIDWGATNTLTAQVDLSEMQAAARHITSLCETRCTYLGVDTIKLEVGVTHPMNTLINNYLSSELFRLVEVEDDPTGPIKDDQLIYKRFGWDD